LTDRRNTRSFWDEKDYAAWADPVPGTALESLPPATRRFLRPLLPVLKGKTVLDLGCGPAFFTPFLAAAAERVVGLDFSATAISVARARCASLDNVSFFEGDVFEWPHEGTFDVIAGRFFLHEVMIEDTPRLLERLDALLAPGGFLYFHENSYFNPVARFVRRRLVGRLGVPKHGSSQELPFDAERFTLYARHFKHCDRFVDGVELAQKVYEYLVPLKQAWLGRLSAAVDRGLDALQARTGLLDNWSYTQSIYASHSTPRIRAFGAGRHEQP
jgi:SAM-dependent methyltransferase